MRMITCRDCGNEREFCDHGRRCRECWNVAQRARAKWRYDNDPAYRARIQRHSQRQYHKNRDRELAKQRERYATDPDFKARIVSYARKASRQRSKNLWAARETPATAVVYFIADDVSQAIKIGHTDGRAEKRLEELQVGNPNTLRIAATVAGSRFDEIQLHHKFEFACLRGEWFRPHPELLALIERINAGVPHPLTAER